jgi:hypothetical protein
MKLRKVKLPVFCEAGHVSEEWFDVNQISAVEGVNWMQQCKVRIDGIWRFVAVPVKEVTERCA